MHAMPVPAWMCDLGRVDYLPTADLQRNLRCAREAGAIPDTLLVLEHEPVITTGHRTEPHEVAYALTTDIPVVPTERGGKATYHGPGQVVAYPVFDLARHGSDIRAFVRTLEQSIIDTLGGFDVDAGRRDGYPGVWVAGRKIASIGVRVTRWVSFHGIALNVDCDLTPFTWFTPCGIPDVEMTSMAVEMGGACPPIGDVRDALVGEIGHGFDLAFSPVPVDRVSAIASEHPAEPASAPVAAPTPACSAPAASRIVLPSSDDGAIRA